MTREERARAEIALRARIMGNWKPRRRKVRLLQQPDAIRASYRKELVGIVRDLGGEIARQFDERVLAGLLASRADAFRTDNYADEIAKALERAAASWLLRWPLERLTRLARSTAGATSSFHREQFRRQFLGAVAIDPIRSEPWLEREVGAFTTANVDLIRSVSDGLKAQVGQLVIAGVRQGRLATDIATDIQARTGVAESRAELIARDQVGKLFGDLQQQRQRSAGVERYTWRTVGDNRVRDAHEEREGKSFLWTQPPPDGHPGEAVNCRCQAIPDLKNLLESL